MPESLISESLSRILGMTPGGGGAPTLGTPASAGTAEQEESPVTLGKGPLSYIAGATDQFGMGSAFGQRGNPSTLQTLSNIAPVTPVAAAPPANPLTAAAPAIPATVPKPAAPATSAPKPAAPAAPASPFVSGTFTPDMGYYNMLQKSSPQQAQSYVNYINAMNTGKTYYSGQ